MILRINPAINLKGEITAPPSKSYSHRAFIASSLAKGVSIIKNPLIFGDVAVTIDILKSLGHRISRVSNETYMVKSNIGSLKPIKKILDCKNSGTSIRIFCALAMLLNGGLSFTGEFLRRKRPIVPLLNALESIGCIYDLSENILKVKRKGKSCNTIEIPGDKSSQFISALLMMCPLLNCKKIDSITVRITSPIVSYPYVKITLNVLKSFAINIQENLDENKLGKYIIYCDQSYRAQTYEIPGDFSSASFMIAAAVLSPLDSKVVINNLDFDKPQGDQKIIEILQKMGAKIEVFQDRKRVSVSGNLSMYPLTGLTIDLEDTPDLFPILSVVGALANGKTELCNISSIRGKESDRISLMAQGLSKMGVKVIEEEDKLIVFHCDQLKGSNINHGNDHRIAMALVIASMWATTPSQISKVEVVEDSYPNFIEDIVKLGAKVEKLD